MEQFKGEEKIFFVVGNSRSGTTLMGNILGINPMVFAFNELHFFEKFLINENQMVDESDSRRVLHRLFCSSRLHPFKRCRDGMFKGEIEDVLRGKVYPVNGLELFRDFLFYETRRNGKSIPCEQTPRNLFYLDFILNYFHQARVVFMVRDPRDALLSQKFKWKRLFKSKSEPYPLFKALRNFINYHPITVSLLWKVSTSFIIPYLPNPLFKGIKFEELIFNPEKTVRDLCDFLGIGFNEKMLDVPYTFSSVFKDEQEKTGFDTRRTGNWKKKLNSAEVFFVELIAGNLMQHFGYEKSNRFPNPLLLIYYLITFLPKILFAMLFNLPRNKNIFFSVYNKDGSFFQ